MEEKHTNSSIPFIPLKDREYWSVNQAVAVLGRTNRFWRDAFDNGLVVGYSTEGGKRQILADSAREYLAARGAERQQQFEDLADADAISDTSNVDSGRQEIADLIAKHKRTPVAS